MKNKIKTNKILELASKVILNGNAEILVSYINNLERKIEKREDCLAQMKELKRQQQFEFYNQLEVELWKTELSLLQGKLDLVRHQSKCEKTN
jgi:tRNA U55 pseudouridine synthase TruB